MILQKYFQLFIQVVIIQVTLATQHKINTSSTEKVQQHVSSAITDTSSTYTPSPPLSFPLLQQDAPQCDDITTNDSHMTSHSMLWLLHTLSSSSTFFDTHLSSLEYDSLECWLWNLKLYIPDERFKKGILSVTLHDMVCTNFIVNSVSSSYHPSNSEKYSSKDSTNPTSTSSSTTSTPPSLSLSINGISTTCQGRYRSGLTGGVVTVTVESQDNKPFSLETVVVSKSWTLPNNINVTHEQHLEDSKIRKNGDDDTKSSYQRTSSTKATSSSQSILVPDSTTISFCETNLQVPKDHGIIFSGSISAKLIGLFGGSIAKHVTSALSDQVCPPLKLVMESKITEGLHIMDSYLEDLIRNSTIDNSLSGNDGTYFQHEDLDQYHFTNNPLPSQRKGNHERVSIPGFGFDGKRTIINNDGLIPSSATLLSSWLNKIGIWEDESEISYDDESSTITTTTDGVDASNSENRFEQKSRRLSSMPLSNLLNSWDSDGQYYDANRNTVAADDDDNTTSPTLLTWDNDLALMKKALISINQYLTNHMDMGMLLSLLDKWGWLQNGDENKQSYFGINPSGTSECDEDCGFFFRGVNGYIKYLTNGTGAISFSTNETVPSQTPQYNSNNAPTIIVHIPHVWTLNSPSLGNVTVTLESFNISGLDQLSDLNLAYPQDEQNLSFKLKSKEGFTLVAQIHIQIQTNDTDSSILHGGGDLDEVFVFQLDISDVVLGGNLEVGVNKNKIQNVTMGDILFPGKNASSCCSFGDCTKPVWWLCMAKSLTSLIVQDLRTQMHVDLIKITPVAKVESKETTHNLSSELESGIDELINNCLRLILEEYSGLVTQSLVAYGKGPLKIILNDLLDHFVQNITPQSSQYTNYPDTSSYDHFFDFNSSALIKMIYSYLDDSESISTVNTYISCVMLFLQNDVQIPDYIHHLTIGKIEVMLEDLNVENVGNINSADIMRPEDQSHLIFGVTGYECPFTNSSYGCDTSLTTKLQSELQCPDIEFDLHLLFDSAIENVSSMAGSLVQYDTDMLAQLKLLDILETPQSLLIPLAKLGFYGFGASVGDVNIELNISATYGDYYKYLSFMPSGGKLGDDVTTLSSTLMSIIEDVTNTLSQLLLPSPPTYGYTPDERLGLALPKVENSFFTTAIVIVLVFIVANVLFFYLPKCSSDNNSVDPPTAQQDEKNEAQSKDPVPSPSLMFKKNVSNCTRIVIPLVIVATITAFIASNLSTGAGVDLKVRGVDGSTILSLPDITTFSLGKTVGEMYHAKVYTLMLLVLVFSGVWPYIKLIMMLVSWLLPEQYLSLKRRESLLIWLDALGKYSLVDSYVLVLTLVSFRFHIDIPGIGSIDSYVTPTFGFYLFMMSTVSSLVVGHAVTFLHRRSTDTHTIDDSQLECTKSPIKSHLFRTNFGEYKLTHRFNILWSLLASATVCLIGIGVNMKTFIFEFKGIAGVALGDKRTAEYSVVSLGSHMPSSTENPSDFGIHLIQWTYYFFALFMPALSIIVMFVLYHLPMTLKGKQFIFTMAEICNAWSAIEVFLISVFASLLELSQFAAFMVGDKCDFLKGNLDQFDDILHGEDTCFDIQSSLGRGTSILCTGVLLHSWITFFTLKMAHCALDQEKARSDLSNNHLAIVTESTLMTNVLEIISRSKVGKLFIERGNTEEDTEEAQSQS